MAGNGAAVLEVEGVVKRFGKNVVLDGLDLRVEAGENLAVLGRSGTGKSVLLKIITGLLAPDSGRVAIWGQPTEGLSEDGWLPLRRRMGMVFQSSALFDAMSVFDNVAFPLREIEQRPEDEVRRIVEERLAWVGLAGTGDLPPSDLSGGMRRRAALARTIAAGPEFVLYDEPTAGLDPATARMISRLIRDLDARIQSTSVVVTHDLECARLVASRWVFLSEGRILADGTPASLFSSTDPELREFLRGGEAGSGSLQELAAQEKNP